MPAERVAHVHDPPEVSGTVWNELPHVQHDGARVDALTAGILRIKSFWPDMSTLASGGILLQRAQALVPVKPVSRHVIMHSSPTPSKMPSGERDRAMEVVRTTRGDEPEP